MYRTQMKIGGPLTPVVKNLMIINATIFLIQMVIKDFGNGNNFLNIYFGLSHSGLIIDKYIWQIFSYMFLHGGWLHVIFNLLALWMFGGELERKWGSKYFLKYYIFSGIGAGIFIALLNYLTYAPGEFHNITIGASGAIFGILLAYGLTWPNKEILLYFVIPVKIKYLIIGYGIISFYGTLTSLIGNGNNISHIGHLGGLISGFIILKYMKNSPVKNFTISKNGGFLNSILRKRRMKKKKLVIKKRILAKKIIDTLLEKITKTGMNSLTEKEKKDLEWARKNFYPDNNDTIH